jgi:hypothetical protein
MVMLVLFLCTNWRNQSKDWFRTAIIEIQSELSCQTVTSLLWRGLEELLLHTQATFKLVLD